MDAQQPTSTPPPTLKEQVKALASQGLGVTAICKQLGRPMGTISPLLTTIRREQAAFNSGASAQAHSQAQTQPDRKGTSSASLPRQLSPEERSRIAALKLLAKVSREGLLGNRKFATDTERKEARAQMEERVDAAKSIIAKVKPPTDEDEESKRTAYAGMLDEELAEHVVTAAAASLGVAKLREVLDRLAAEGTLIKSPGEHAAEAAGQGNGLQATA